MKDEPVDLSVLDPARDAERWERRVQAVVARALASRRWTVAGQLSNWARPALALAAAAALFSWLGLALSLETLETGTQEDAVSALSRWAEGAERPSAGKLLSVLGEGQR